MSKINNTKAKRNTSVKFKVNCDSCGEPIKANNHITKIGKIKAYDFICKKCNDKGENHES